VTPRGERRRPLALSSGRIFVHRKLLIVAALAFLAPGGCISQGPSASAPAPALAEAEPWPPRLIDGKRYKHPGELLFKNSPGRGAVKLGPAPAKSAPAKAKTPCPCPGKAEPATGKAKP
jgi:hypothetical protein